jgi:hypothetical protein
MTEKQIFLKYRDIGITNGVFPSYDCKGSTPLFLHLSSGIYGTIRKDIFVPLHNPKRDRMGEYNECIGTECR